ncbi:MAG: ATP-dependent helicase HrpB [Sandaracinaceae bacterium]|nr:ATP-dependent helicase HrpB [Sandaracinaceae bacterium]
MTLALPIDPRLPEIVARVRDRGALVLVAEPGAGKTTRAPRALLESELASRGEILVLEPRRLATRLSAARVAEELGEPLGKRVGYTIRFDDVGGKDTRLRFVTEAVLTRRLVRDPELRGVSCVVLDELHERSLHADLALAFVKRLRETTRPDLRVLAMSATIDAARFAAFLGCEVLSVSGRPYDVAIEHLEQRDERPIEEQVRAAVRRIVLSSAANGVLDGHVLVFLPGAAEIRRCASALEETARSQDLEVLPLHGDLPPEEQDRAVKRGTRRKVILATNVAETSITIDGVVAVVDSGLERAASFSPWSGVGELVTAPICQASATQRAGRAGRTRAGRAIRLYTKHDFDGRPAFLKPEIQRVDLCDTRLFLARMGVHDAKGFPFFEAPSVAAIDRAERTLSLLGALDDGGAVTAMGRDLAELPVHPRLGRVAIEAARTGHRDRGAAMAALLGEKEIRLSLRTRFGDRGGDRHAASGDSDALARLEAFEGVTRSGPLAAGRVRSHDLDVGATLAAGRTAEQLARTLARMRLDVDEARAIFDEDEAMLRALLAGYPDRVGKRRRAGSADVVLAGGGAVRLAESSVVRDPEWMVIVEADERRGAIECRVASAIEPEWLLELFPERVRDLSEIRFDRDKERLEKLTALEYEGLTLDESRSDAAGQPGAAEVLAKAALAAGLGRFLDVHELDQWKLRTALARRVDPSIPALDDAHVLEVLAQAAEGRRSLKELEGAEVLTLLTSGLGHDVLAKLDRLVPTHVKLPGRAKVPVTYEHDRPPWIESRMQDFFGLADGPSAGGAPIVLHLLAPNHRAVQVTTDLAGFWQRHYPTLKKQLSREYPRHFWPDDPRNAEPPPPRGPRRT